METINCRLALLSTCRVELIEIEVISGAIELLLGDFEWIEFFLESFPGGHLFVLLEMGVRERSNPKMSDL